MIKDKSIFIKNIYYMLSYAFTTLNQGGYEDVAVVRGKIDMPGTIQNRLSRRRVLTCEYDELSENNLLNQILKTTVTLTTAIPAASYSIWKRCCIWMAVPAAHHGATPSQRISMSTVVTFTLSPRPKQLP